MRHAALIRGILAGAIASLVVPSLAPAAVLYKTGFGNYDKQADVGYNPSNASYTSYVTTYTATGGAASTVATGGRGEGRGDDYATNFTTLSITSLRFVGSLQPNADGVAIEFWNADGTRNTTATIYPSNTIAELQGSTTAHTVTLSSPVTISGRGYVIFAPYTYSYSTGAAPAITLGYSDGYHASLYDVGTNDAATSYEANYGPTYPASTARTLSPVDLPFQPDRLSFELDGAGIGVLPEPTTVALFAPAALLLKRRRRQN